MSVSELELPSLGHLADGGMASRAPLKSPYSSERVCSAAIPSRETTRSLPVPFGRLYTLVAEVVVGVRSVRSGRESLRRSRAGLKGTRGRRPRRPMSESGAKRNPFEGAERPIIGAACSLFGIRAPIRSPDSVGNVRRVNGERCSSEIHDNRTWCQHV